MNGDIAKSPPVDYPSNSLSAGKAKVNRAFTFMDHSVGDDSASVARAGCVGPTATSNPSSLAPLQLFVKTLNGKTITVNTSASASVHDVKLHVQAKTGIPANEQRLIFGGMQLEDERGVVASGVGEWSTLHLSLRLCGGAMSLGQILAARKDPFDDAQWTPDLSSHLVRAALKVRRVGTDRESINGNDILGDEAIVRKSAQATDIANFLPENLKRYADDIFRGELSM